jgi:hypothetical protein
MPDITMCKSEECEKRMLCFRSTAVPDPYGQSYSDFTPEDAECEYYLPQEA